ncbi:MAG: hypothetical protein C4K58_07940 [Flavobacteriaceae bacterium]|nr:MAG: hypothetical protein C4K58_07940 [Flavobacteriaceae bacterium]
MDAFRERLGERQEIFISTLDECKVQLKKGDLKHCVIQNIDLTGLEWDFEKLELYNTFFLACHLSKSQIISLIGLGAFVYPKFKGLPYQPFRNTLYNWQELLDGYHPTMDQSVDLKIYQNFVQTKFIPPVYEALAQRIHDHNIDRALKELIGYSKDGMTQKKAIGIMGGHSVKRSSSMYQKVAVLAKMAQENGYFVVSGGGPGIMEAANLGAYFGGKKEKDLFKAIEILSDLNLENENQVDYLASNYISNAQKVLELYPVGQKSLAIPTWFYGHEPSNLFASVIAKFFSNSIREDTLLAICLHGVIFAPGSAGTTQEIFQEAAQNHYGTMGYFSPMVFLGKERYQEETQLYAVLKQLSMGKEYHQMLHLTDEPKEVISFLISHPPIPKKV